MIKEETQGFEQALKHYFKKLYGVISSRKDSSALRPIKTASWIKRLFIKTSEAFLSDACVNDEEAVPWTLWHFSPLHY